MTQVKTEFAGDSWASLAFYRFARFWVLMFSRVMFRLTWEGRENIPTSGAFVLAPVHRSNIDTLVSSVVTRRRLRYMGKDSLWKKQPWRWMLSALGGFPVSRGSADREALTRSIDVLKGGEPLVLFPEGERKSGPIVHPLRDGAAYVATKAGVPIVPVGIGGSERAMTKGSKKIHFVKVHVIVGPPIDVPKAVEGSRVPRAAITEVSEKLHSELQRLFDLAQTKSGAA